jgi:hypothetical protein
VRYNFITGPIKVAEDDNLIENNTRIEEKD